MNIRLKLNTTHDAVMRKTGIITIAAIIVIIVAIALFQNPVQNAPSIGDSPEINEQVKIIQEAKQNIVDSPEISDSATVSTEESEIVSDEEGGRTIIIEVGDTPIPIDG